jgi:hypothetical protein
MPVAHMDGEPFRLPPNLTVRAINAVQQEMLQFIAEKSAMTLQLDGDYQVDISFIQLVEAARIYAGSVGKPIALSAPASGSLLDTLERAGFLEGMNADDAKFWLHEGVIQ